MLLKLLEILSGENPVSYICVYVYMHMQSLKWGLKIGWPFLVSSSIIIDYYAYLLEMYGRFCPINSGVGINFELGGYLSYQDTFV